MEIWNCLIILFVVLSASPCQGDVSCFKKFRPNSDTCGGLYKKKMIGSPDHCCGGLGMGFTTEQLELISHNKYKCMSCTEWEKQKNIPDPSALDEDFHCFRKYRDRQRTCGGPLRRKPLTNPAECCSSKGNGFSRYGLDKLRKNQYTCVSCEEWRKQNDTITTAVTTEAPAHWGAWGDCSTSCFYGTQTRHRLCTNCDPNHRSNIEIRDCLINFYCPINGKWSEWTSWEHCSNSCNGGIRRRHRKCDSPKPKYGGRVCVGLDSEQEPCNDQACPIDGHWGQWTRFGRCSTSCGLGTMVRKRECSSPAPRHGGKHCKGPSENSRRCEHRKCPVHGGWTSWNEWSGCPVTCGSGTRTRTRQCNRPPPLFGGRRCAGSPTETDTCTSGSPCPIDGGWSSWNDYGRCRAAPCERGHKLRSRVCNNPRPRNGGLLCRGRSVERTGCNNTEECGKNLVAGGWCEYTAWSPCSDMCESFFAVQARSRECQCPAPQNGGKPCIVDGGWSSWNDYGRCRAAPCERGHKLRSRVCNNPRPRNGGLLCRGRSVERTGCNNTEECGKNLVAGGWCEYTAWSPCSATCQTFFAVQARSRECQCPAPQNGGKPCIGERYEFMACKGANPCDPPFDGLYEG